MPKKIMTVLALFPLVAGLMTMLAWWGHVPFLLQLTPSQVPMSFNSGLCSFLSGVALLFSIHPATITQRVQIIFGLILLIMSGMTLSEDMFGMNLHIDELCVQCWLPDASPHPGRMALNTSLSFFFTGLALFLFPFAYKTIVAIVIEISIFLLFLFGVLGLTGYLLKMEFLYSWYSYTRMALLCSIGFVTTSIVLWGIWRESLWYEALYEGKQDTKIILLNAAILLSVALTVGLATFTDNLRLIFIVTTVSIMVGLFLLRLQVVPLVRRVINAEQELLRANKRLRDTEERYMLAIKGSHVGLWDWVVGSKQIFSSPYLKAMLGFAEHEMPDTVEFYRQSIHPEDLKKVSDLAEQHFLEHIPYEVEFRIKMKTGEYHWFLSVGQAVWDAEGNPTRMAGSMTDITERKNLEKLKDEFISIVSHELRTPLTSIRGALGLILGGKIGVSSDKAKSLIEIANNNCERLALLINDILDIEKIEAGKMNFHLKVVGIDQIVNEAIVANKIYAEKFDVSLHLLRSQPGVKVYADPDRLIQVLTNLISNAVKFSPTGGDVVIEITSDENRVRVSIADKGKGIPEEFRSHVFERFAQADVSTTREEGGTGLGLSISKAIIEKLGGTLDFESKLSEGATFYFELPQSSVVPGLMDGEAKKITEDSGKHRLLICEDDDDQARYLSSLLSVGGYATDIAYSVSQAKQLIQKNQYYALLLDLLLPDQDGIAFIRELRDQKKTATLPIIVLSVVAQTGKSLLEGEALSVVDWLNKPVDFNKLLNAIHMIDKSDHKTMPHILHVDDDVSSQQIISELLSDRADITTVNTVLQAEKKLAERDYDLVILDIRLPDGKGTDLLPQLAKRQIPVVVFSAVELDHALSRYVSQTLMKSKASYQELLATISSVLGKLD